MPDALSSMLEAIEANAWLAVVGYGITLVLAIARKLGPGLWAKLPRRAQWVPAVVLAAFAGAAEPLMHGGTWQQAVAVAVYAGAVAGCVAVGALHTAKRLTGRTPKPPEEPD
jgi:hypothetical protein